MRTVWIIMCKDLLRRLRSPLALVVYLLFPFIFSGLMALAFGTGGGGSIPRFKVALVNQDGGFVSRFVLGAFNQEQVSRYFESTEVALDEAMRLVERNKVAGAIIIPEGFSDAVLERRQTHLRVIKNPAQSIGPMAIEEAAEMICRLLDGAAKVLEEPLGRFVNLTRESEDAARENSWAGFPADENVAEIARMVNRSLREVRRFAFPPVIRLEKGDDREVAGGRAALDSPDDTGTGAAGDAGASAGTGEAGDAGASADAGGSGASAEDSSEDSEASRFLLIFQHVLPGMATFALLILALGFMADIPRERRMGTLARQLAAPVLARDVVAGKIMSTMVMGLIVAAAMAVVGALLLKARADLGGFILLSLAFLGASTGLLAVVFGSTRSEQQGATLASIIVMLMSLLGGSWIPLNVLPPFFAKLAQVTLNYWAIRGYQSLIMSEAGIPEIAVPLVILFAVGIVGTLAGSWVMQRRLMQGV